MSISPTEYQNLPELDAAHQRFFAAYRKLLLLSNADPENLDRQLKMRYLGKCHNVASFACIGAVAEQAKIDYRQQLEIQRGRALSTEEFFGDDHKARLARIAKLEQYMPKIRADRIIELPFEKLQESLKMPQTKFTEDVALTMVRDGASNGLEHFLDSLVPGLPGHDTELLMSLQHHLLRDRAKIGRYNAKEPLLMHFASGQKHLYELSQEHVPVPWMNYLVALPSQTEMLLSTMLETFSDYRQNSQKKIGSNSEFKAAVDEFKAAFAEACISPRQREAEAAEQQRIAKEREQQEALRRLAALQKEEEAALGFSSYSLSPALLSIQTRANRPQSPVVELQPAWKELLQVTNKMNCNFGPHKDLGDMLFREGEGATRNKLCPVMDVLNNIATGESYQPMLSGLWEEHRSRTRQKMLDFIARPVDELTPDYVTPGLRERVIDANRQTHETLLSTLLDSPYLLIAAIGSPQEIVDARALQQMLYPKKKQDIPDDQTAAYLREELRALAGTMLSHAFDEAGITPPPSIQEAIQKMQRVVAEPTLPPPPAPVTPPEAKKEPPREITPLNWDELVQRTDKFIRSGLSDAPPFTMFRANLSMQPGHAITLHMSRWVGNDMKRVETRSDTLLLGEPNLERALEIKKRLQSHVFNAHDEVVEHRRLHEGHYVVDDGSFLPMSPPAPDRVNPAPDGKAGHIMKRGGVYALRLQFPHNDPQTGTPTYTEMEMSLGVRQAGDINEADRRRVEVVDYLEKNLSHGRHVTMQDVRSWLQARTINHQGVDAWQQAESIDLRQHPEIARRIEIDFPPNADPQHKTVLTVQSPRLQGSPIPFWTIPLSLSINGREFASPSVNTHVADTEMAIARIDEVTSHIKTELERYGATHPGANWRFQPSGRLDQLDAHNLAASDMDWTRLDRITDELGYINRLDVKASNISKGDDGRLTFTLGIQRADGSDFLEVPYRDGRPAPGMQPKPVARVLSVPAGDDVENAARIEHVRTQVQASFKRVMDEAYQPYRDRQFEPGDYEARKTPEAYSAQSIVAKFRGALLSTAERLRTEEQLDIQGEGTEPTVVAASAASRIRPRPNFVSRT